MEQGSEPLEATKTAAAKAKWLLVTFAKLYSLLSRFQMAGVVFVSLLAAVIGGVAWQRLCKVYSWPFFLGGPNNEPYGVYAFVWGAITLFPVILSVRLATTQRGPKDALQVLTWLLSREFVLVLVYTVLSGAIAIIFYGFRRGYGFRALVDLLRLGFEYAEMLVIVVWAVALGFIPSISVKVLGGNETCKNWISVCLLPAAIASIICLLSLSSYFWLYDYKRLDPAAQVRGLIAGPALRLGIFWGLWLIIDCRNLEAAFERARSWVREWLSTN